MKKIFMVLLIAAVALMFVGTALAVPPGKTLQFEAKGMGAVTFSGKIHADAGLKCMDCHAKIFKMKKGADKITMSDINAGKFCGECHNGTKAFKASDPANCKKCHK